MLSTVRNWHGVRPFRHQVFWIYQGQTATISRSCGSLAYVDWYVDGTLVVQITRKP